MTQKLLLAESLDLLRQTEFSEYDADKRRQFIEGNSGSKSRDDGIALTRSYEAVYRQFLLGVEIMNYVRHLALQDKNPRYAHNLATFCANKMTFYMDRAEQILPKLDSIKLPADKVESMTLPNYTLDTTLYSVEGAENPLTMSKPVHTMTRNLSYGTYLLIVKSADKHTVASPSVRVMLRVRPEESAGVPPMNAEGTLTAHTAWRKVFGVWKRATVELEVRATGMRDAHVDIVLQQWSPTRQGGSGGRDREVGPVPDQPSATTSKAQDLFGISLPQLDDEDLDAISGLMKPPSAPAAPVPTPSAGPTMNTAPHAEARRSKEAPDTLRSVEVNPDNMNCAQRLEALRAVLNEWPSGGTDAVSLPHTTESGLHEILTMPLPRPIEDGDE